MRLREVGVELLDISQREIITELPIEGQEASLFPVSPHGTAGFPIHVPVDDSPAFVVLPLAPCHTQFDFCHMVLDVNT